MKNILSVMAAQIKSYRKKRGYTQVRLSSESGVELRHLQRIEAGSVDIRLGTVQRIAQTLKIPASQLFQDQSEQKLDIEDIGQLGPYQILNGLNFGIQVIDTDGLVRYCNQNWANMLGYTVDEVQNKMSIWQFMPDANSAEKLRAYIHDLVEKRPEPTEVINPNLTKTGEKIWVHVKWNYLLNKDGKVIGFMSGITQVEEPEKGWQLKVLNGEGRDEEEERGQEPPQAPQFP